MSQGCTREEATENALDALCTILTSEEKPTGLRWNETLVAYLHDRDLLGQSGCKGHRANAARRPLATKKMVDDTRSYLRPTQRRPDIVVNYFEGKHVSYAKAT